MRHARPVLMVRRSPAGRWAVVALGALAAMAWLGIWPSALPAAAATRVADYAERGPYPVEAREIKVTRAGSDGEFEARLFIPLPDEADPRELESSAMLAFGHGYLSPVELYESTLQHLASWGITVVAPRSGGELLPSHERFASDLSAALDAVAALAAGEGWTGLPVEASARAVGGHSMGGGAALLSAAADPSIRTVATLNAAETRPSAAAAAAGVTAPVLLVAGSEDRIAPIEAHQRPMFEAAAGSVQLRTIEGGGHCGSLDGSAALDLVCGRSSLASDIQHALERAALTSWLRGQLMGDEAATEAVWRTDSDPRVSVETRGPGAS